jgi:hypothetical protein
MIEKTLINSIKVVTRAFYDAQDDRLKIDGRLGQKKNGEIKKNIPERDKDYLHEIYDRRQDLYAYELEMERKLKESVQEQPIWHYFLKHVTGCGETMAAVIISEIDIHKAETVSKIWQYAGLNSGMVQGKTAKGKGIDRKVTVHKDLIRGDKLTQGFLSPYNQFLKAKMVGTLAGCMIRAQSEYALKFYYPYKHRLECMDWGKVSKNPTDPKRPKAGHQDKAAKRYMIKMFIKDLYVAWRTLEELPVRVPYAEEYLNKVHQVAA